MQRPSCVTLEVKATKCIHYFPEGQLMVSNNDSLCGDGMMHVVALYWVHLARLFCYGGVFL